MVKKRSTPGDRSTFKVTQVTRRQFFQRFGISLGSAVIGGISLASACKSTITSAVSTFISTAPVSSHPATSAPPITPPIASVTSIPATSNGTSLVATTSYSYEPPAEQPSIIRVPSSECTIATDRMYSKDYIWVKSVSTSMVVIGITPTLITMISRPYALSLVKVGIKLVQGTPFGEIEGQKVAADMLSPISGKVVQVNEIVVRQGMGQGEYMPTVNSDPWNGGWMLVVQMDRPDELNALMKPQDFLVYLGH